MNLTCLMAQTLDGRIAKDQVHFPDWTEKADKIFFMNRTKQSRVLIMGRTTFETLPGVLPGRLHVILSRKALDWEERGVNLIFTSLSPEKILEKLSSLGYENPILAGGTTINSLFAKQKLINELVITISPTIFGIGLGVFEPFISLDLVLKKYEKIGKSTLLVWYDVKK